MGHVRLGRLPRKGKWKQVIQRLGDDTATAGDVAEATLAAAEEVLVSAERDPGVSYCLWVLTQVTHAARSTSFAEILAPLGIKVSGHESASELLSRVSRAVSSKLQTSEPYTLLTDVAQLSMREVLTELVARHVPTLFGATFEDARLAYRRFSTQKQFGLLARHFFAAFLRRTILLVLDKERSNHIGANRRFASIGEADGFTGDLAAFCYETAYILEDFSGAWYSKRQWEGGISEQDTRQFVHVALGKLIADVQLSEGSRP